VVREPKCRKAGMVTVMISPHSPPYRGQRIHPNSIEAYWDLDIPLRWRAVFEVYIRLHPKNLTDRNVLYHISGSYAGDMNKVRPRITEMVADEATPLWEKGRTKCRITGKMVRVVGLAEIAPKPCTIPKPIGILSAPMEKEIQRLYPAGQQSMRFK